MGVDQRGRVKALRRRENMQSAPIDSGLDQALDERRHALGIDPERARPGAHRHPAIFDREGRVDPDRELGAGAKLLAGEDRAAGLAFAFDADHRARGDPRLELVVALARPGEVHRDAGQLGPLQPLELAFRDDPEAIDISSKKIEQRFVRVCGNGIIYCKAVRHGGPQTGQLRADDIIVVDEQGRAAGFRHQLLGGAVADQEPAVAVGGEIGWDRSGRLHSIPLLGAAYSAAIASYSCAARYFSASSAAMHPVPAAVTAWR